MATRKQVEQGLEDIGACWAVRSDKYVSPDDGYDAKPTYHVHPDASYPHIRSIRRFESLNELMSWINESKLSEMLNKQDGGYHEVFLNR